MRTSIRRVGAAVARAVVIGVIVMPIALSGCLSIEQSPCEAAQTRCVSGVVWACVDDGSAWAIEVVCPDGACEDGRCILPPVQPIDAWQAPAADTTDSTAVGDSSAIGVDIISEDSAADGV